MRKRLPRRIRNLFFTDDAKTTERDCQRQGAEKTKMRREGSIGDSSFGRLKRVTEIEGDLFGRRSKPEVREHDELGVATSLLDPVVTTEPKKNRTLREELSDPTVRRARLLDVFQFFLKRLTFRYALSWDRAHQTSTTNMSSDTSC